MAHGAGYKQAEIWEPPTPGPRWVAHVDMDAFFASVEQHDDPQLFGQPVVVCNSPLPFEELQGRIEQARALRRMPDYIRGIRGVVASASYEARAFGARSAMPLARALALCPDAVVLPGRFARYREVARQLRAIWAGFSPIIEPVSLDEGYLDLSGACFPGLMREIGMSLKTRIRDETGLTASVGIAANKLVAKIASDLQKPDGLTLIERGDEAHTMAPLPVRALPGIGPRTAEALKTLGITTIGQLAFANEQALIRLFGFEHAASLLRRSIGVDNSPVQIPGDPKSISRETTLTADTADLLELKALLKPLVGSVTRSLRTEGLHARCVFIKLRLLPKERVWRPEGYGRLITRRRTMFVPVAAAQPIYELAQTLLDSAAASTGLGEGREVVRLLGVGVDVTRAA